VVFASNRALSKAESAELRRRAQSIKPKQGIVSLPARGVFAETQLSKCSSCEKRDVTRFWDWTESPCPEEAPAVEDIAPGPRGTTPTPQPGALPSPVVQITQPPAAPDPIGMAAALTLLGKGDTFRDMSGGAELQQLLSGLTSGAVDLAKARQLAKQVQAKQQGDGRLPAGSNGAKPPKPQQRYDEHRALQADVDEGLLTPDDARRIALAGWERDRSPGTTSSASTEPTRTAPVGEAPPKILLDGIATDARLQDAYGRLVREGWMLRRDNLWFRNATIDAHEKLLVVDDSADVPVATVVEWVRRAVRMAYHEDHDLRRVSERDHALSVFQTPGLTALEKMAQTYEWSVWYWVWPLESGDPVELMDDMMLVLTESSPNLLSSNDGRYHIFSSKGLRFSVDTTGFKRQFREHSPQVRHATASIQASLTAGSVGYLLAQLQELRGSLSPADIRLNRACFDIAQNMREALPGWTAAGIGATLRRELGDPTQTGPWTGPPEGDPDP
jgi:hypothetical protein